MRLCGLIQIEVIDTANTDGPRATKLYAVSFGGTYVIRSLHSNQLHTWQPEKGTSFTPPMCTGDELLDYVKCAVRCLGEEP